MINCYELSSVKKHMTKSINPHYNRHHIKVPFRGMLIGSSGAGKTNLLVNLIHQFGKTFNKLIVYTRAEEPIYSMLTEQLGDMMSISYNLDDCRAFDESKFYGQTLVVFDDMVNERDQKCIQELYIRGRKIAGGVSLLYLTQSYYQVPKIIRQQCQYIFILKVSGQRDLKMILSEYSLGVDKNELTAMYEYCCGRGVFGDFMLIDLEAGQNKTYRKNFDEYLSQAGF